MKVDLGIPVLHVSQLLEEFVRKGRLRLRQKQPLRVTYHDPCHLGRLGEPYLGDWPGDKRQRPAALRRAGKHGVYDAPRRLLEAIPGLELVEMERIRQYSWCCGAGGGVLEAYPDFAAWTAMERLEEARSTGAEALVTACPWCERSFLDVPLADSPSGTELKIYDLHELLAVAAGIREGVAARAV
jgi:Fe-S oxidoreductase